MSAGSSSGGPVGGFVEATATVIGVRATGSYVNHDPILDFDLAVVVAAAPPVPINHKELVPQRLLHRVQLGGTLAVRISETNIHDLAIDWERSR